MIKKAMHVTDLTTLLIQGKRNPRAADLTVDNAKNPQFLVLISENFMEARSALSRPGVANMPANQSPLKLDTASAPISGPAPTSIPSGSFPFFLFLFPFISNIMFLFCSCHYLISQ